jgi:hypothetical protein
VDAALIQKFRCLAFGMALKQLIEHFDDFRACFPLSEIAHGQREFQGGRRPASKTHVSGDVLRLDQRHVFDHQTDHAFALALRSLRVAPDRGEVLG